MASLRTVLRPLCTRSLDTYLRLQGHGKRSISTSVATFGNMSSKLPRLQHTIPETYKDFEVSTAEWSFVERILPAKVVPKPQVKPGEVTPSGWVAPSAQPGDHPYFISRNANHMLPVYVKNEPMMSRSSTFVRHVEGDVFALGEEIRQYLSEKVAPRHINLHVHEPHQMIHIKGQYLLEVREFLINKGF